MQLPGSRAAQAQQLWHMDLVAPRHVGFSRTKDLNCLLHWQADSLPLSHQGSTVYKFWQRLKFSMGFPGGSEGKASA